jgi:hypothetical protein
MAYFVSGREREPWVMAPLGLFVSILCTQTDSNNMAGLLLCLPYLLEYAMEVLTGKKPWLLLLAVVQEFRVFSGTLTLGYIFREPVRISILLLITGSFVLRAWLGPKDPKPSLLRLSYSVLSWFCLARLVSIYTRRWWRSVEFSYDQEAQDTVEILGGPRWLKISKVDPDVQNAAHSKWAYTEFVMQALITCCVHATLRL